MKKMTSFLALVLALSIPSGAYAAEAKLDDENNENALCLFVAASFYILYSSAGYKK